MLYNLIIRYLGLQPYIKILKLMNDYTKKRDINSNDEIWLVQHEKVFTQGHSGNNKHLLNPGNIPVVKSDRGGQITFHGPGQQLMYILLDIRRCNIKPGNLVDILEKTVISTLLSFSILSNSYVNEPGIYIGKYKICSIGLRIINGCSFHGLAINVSMDLSYFLCINPCGKIGLRMIQIMDFYPKIKINNIIPILLKEFLYLFLKIKNHKFYNKIILY